MERKYKVLRDITPEECHWLDATVPKGVVVHEYHAYTYGCISPQGVACTVEPGQTPFFELPRSGLALIVEIN